MEYGLLLLRLVVGLIVAAHGSQKLFGWFGGDGPAGTRAYVARLGYRRPGAAASIAGVAQLAGGLLFAAGLVTPLAALAIVVVLLNVVAAVHYVNGFFNANGGFEFHVVLTAVAVAVTTTGPGRISFDRLLGWDDSISGAAWGAGVLGVAAVVAFFTTTWGRGEVEATEIPA